MSNLLEIGGIDDAIARLIHTEMISSKLIISLEVLSEANGSSDHAQGFHLLATNTLEILLKAIIGWGVLVRLNSDVASNKIVEMIIKEQSRCSHNICTLFDKESLCEGLSQLKLFLNLEKVEEVNIKLMKHCAVNGYRFIFCDGTSFIIKDSEAVRFGSLARIPDRAISLSNKEAEAILSTLKRIREYLGQYRVSCLQKDCKGGFCIRRSESC